LNLKLVHSIRFEGYEYKRQLAAASDWIWMLLV
jgi:hypothetical protein